MGDRQDRRRAGVVIPTTLGPVAIIGLLEEEDDVGRSTVCINRTTDQAGIANAYQDFVRRPTGIVHRLYGKPPFPVYRMDVSAPVEAGSSWQLAVLMAHALRADADRLDERSDSDSDLVWATGTVSPVDYAVGGVGHVAEKLRNSRPLFEEALAAGRGIYVFLPEDNRADIDPDIAAWLQGVGISPVVVSSMEEVFGAIGLPSIPRAASKTVARNVWPGNPYRGLQPFLREHRAIFFGRAKAREEALDLLRTAAGHGRPFLLVHGQSGAGKSSLVQAGLAGDVEERAYEGGVFRTAVINPSSGGPDPASSIVTGLRSLLGDQADSGPVDAASVAPALLMRLREARLAPEKSSTLLVVDQLEEIFEPSIAAEKVVAFGELLAEAVAAGVWVMATIRSDALGLIDRAPALAALARSDRLYRLDRPSRTELAEIVAAPAALAGRAFDDRTIPEQFADIAARSPDSLPLLQTVLYRFYEQADPRGRLTSEGLKRIGGFEGAVGRWADEVREKTIAAGIPGEIFDRTLISLVRIDTETRAAVARPLAYDPASAEGSVLRALADARLVSFHAAVAASSGGALARLAHEALITHWPLLREMVDRLGLAMSQRDELEHRAQRWLTAGEDSGELLRGASRLEQARDLLTVRLVPVAQAVDRYIERSIQAADEERLRGERLAAAELRQVVLERDAAAQRASASRRLQALMGAAAIVCALVAGVALYLYDRAGTAEQAADAKADENAELAREARSSEVRFVAEHARILKREDPEEAQALLAETLQPSVQRDLPHSSYASAAMLLDLAASDRAKLVLGDGPPFSKAIFDRSGKFVLTVSANGRATIWNAANGARIGDLGSGSHLANDAAFSPDGTRVATAGRDRTARIWHVQERRELLVLNKHAHSIYAVRFSHDGSRVLTVAQDGRFIVWDSNSGRDILSVDGFLRQAIRTAEFHPSDSDLVVAAGFVPAAHIWRVSSGEVVPLWGHAQPVRQVAFSPDGTILATASSDRTIRLWNVASRATLHVFSHPAGDQIPIGFRFSPNGRLLASSFGDGSVHVWDVATGHVAATFADHPSAVWSLEFSPDSAYLATASGDRNARLWSLSGQAGPRILRGHNDNVSAVAFSSDGRRLVTAGSMTTRVWEMESAGHDRTLRDHDGPVMSARAEAAGDRVVTASRDRTARISSISTGRTIHVLSGHEAPLNGAEFSPDGRLVVTFSDDGTARIWDAETGMSKHVLRHGGAGVRFAAFTRDGSTVVTVSSDYKIHFWRSDTGLFQDNRDFPGFDAALSVANLAIPDRGEEFVTASGTNAQIHRTDARVVWINQAGTVTSVAYSNDRLRLVTTADDGSVIVWDALDGRRLLTLVDDGVPHRATFSPDGRLVVTANRAGMLKLWDVASNRVLRGYHGHVGAIHSVRFTADGRQLVSAGADATVRIWNVDGLVDPTVLLDQQRLTGALSVSLEKRRSFIRDGARIDDNLDPCDSLARHAFDPKSVAAGGMAREYINVGQAKPACEAAVGREPGNLRFHYQLGRVLAAAGEHSAAVNHFRTAADGGYPMAVASLAVARKYGQGIDADQVEARALFVRAVDLGILISGGTLGWMQWYGEGGPTDRGAAHKSWEAAAAAGDPESNEVLGRIAEGTLGETPVDLDEALFRFAMAVRQANLSSDIQYQYSRTRRATLARILPPEVVADVWKRLASIPEP